LEILISANGFNQKQMDMVSISGRMETDTRANGRTVLNMGKAPISSLWATFTLVNTNLASHTASANTNGKIKANTLASSSTE